MKLFRIRYNTYIHIILHCLLALPIYTRNFDNITLRSTKGVWGEPQSFTPLSSPARVAPCSITNEALVSPPAQRGDNGQDLP